MHREYIKQKNKNIKGRKTVAPPPNAILDLWFFTIGFGLLTKPTVGAVLMII